MYIIFQFWDSFSMLFPKAPVPCGKKVLKQFLQYRTSICMTSKTLSQIFQILFQTEGFKNVFLRSVFFNRYVQLESSFSDEKKNISEIKDTLYYRSCRELTWQSIKDSWSFPKLFIMQNYTDKVDEDVPLTVENVWNFQFL